MQTVSVRTVKIQDKSLEIKSDRKLKADKSNPRHLGSSIPGTVGKVLVKEGDTVTVNMPLMTVEAMKMENEICAAQDGVIASVEVAVGDMVEGGDVLATMN